MSEFIKVKALTHFSSSSFGTFTPGEVFNLPLDVARRYAQNGFVEFNLYETKPQNEAPAIPTVAGTAHESSSLPAVPASTKRTYKPRAKKQTKSSV